MSFCQNCGAEIVPGGAFCARCGAAAVVDNSQPVYSNQNIPYNNISQQPRYALDTRRSLAKFIFLSLVTLGIYSIIVMTRIGQDINTIASRYDHQNTIHYCLVYFVLTPITCGIFSLIWQHMLSNRIGDELHRRNIEYTFSSGTFWGWCILGSLIIVGPFIYYHKLMQSMNLLSEDYNMVG